MPCSLPITPTAALSRIVDPAAELMPAMPWSQRAAVMLLAIALQESGLATRAQAGGGPASGLWQFERNGVRAVLAHPESAEPARKLCAARGCPPWPESAWRALGGDDLLACGFARLLLWCDPRPLPEPGDAAGAWACYLRAWRPGKPGLARWASCHAAALAAVQADAATGDAA